jgi:hypothetical protein
MQFDLPANVGTTLIHKLISKYSAFSFESAVGNRSDRANSGSLIERQIILPAIQLVMLEKGA